jgi:iron(III) transport system substrate-binding protein
LVASLASAAVLMAGGDFARAQAPVLADSYAGIVEAARKEAGNGKFLNMVSSPKGEPGQRAIMDAFQKRFGLKLDWEWLPLTSPISGPRVAELAKSGSRMPSIVGGYPYALYDQWIDKGGLAVSLDWVRVFGGEFKGMQRVAVDGVLEPWRGKLLRQWDVVYAMVYNTNLVKAADVPTDIEALTLPQWRGRFAMSNVSAAPLDILVTHFGEEKILQITKKLVDNQPRYKRGPPAVVGAVVNGEVALAVGGYTALADAQKEVGAPVDWKPMNQVPIGPLFIFMIKGSPQPNVGALFAAWLVSEGLEIQDKAEHLSLLSDPASSAAKKLSAAAPNALIVEPKTLEGQKRVEAAQRAVIKLVSSGGN